MPSALVAALAAPIREVQSLVGPGWTGDPAADPAVALGRARDALTNVSAATRHTWDRTNWTGSGADAAADSRRRRSRPSMGSLPEPVS